MGQITIIKRDGTQINLFRTEPFCTVSQAVQNFTLMGDDNVQLTIQSAEIMDFSIGDKILVGGDEYSIRTNANREIIGENRFTYEVTFYGVMYDLMKTMYRDTDINGKSSKSTFDLTYSLSDLVKVIIYNLNRDYPGIWSFDAANCPVTEPKTFSFSKQNCLQVLQNICNEYGYEFRIDLVSGVRTIRIGKFGSVVTPPAGNAFFEWGKGSGLYKLKEQKVDDKSIITRLWVEGGTENIKSGYRNYSDRLQLPMRRLNNHAHTLSNGTVIPALSEYIGITYDEKRYIEDEDLKNKLGSIEGVEQYDIHPARTGEVTALGDTIYSFADNTMDFDLNEKDTNGTKWLIAETSAKITFITGKLAGQQFEMKEYNHSSKTFTIIKNTDERGLSVPTADSEAFRFVVGDKYKITDINLPDAYVDDAEENLWYAGYDDFHLNRKLVRAQYVLTFDRSYFINALPADSETSVFRVGDYVPVKDVRFNLEKNIRIQKLSRNLLLEHDYTLTISDITTVPIATQIVQEVLEHDIIIEANRLRNTAKARRAWRTTEELRNMVYDTDGYFDSENIKPNSIDTNMLTVGSKSQQFILMDIVLEANVNGLPNRFDVSAGALIHLTIDDSGAKIWNMAATSVTLAESGGYYVFAKCSKSGNQGVFYITQQQIKVEPADDPNNYYFQVGIIGSLHPNDNFRDFITTHGFTRINGNVITTGAITSADGSCVVDLDGNSIDFGDANSSLSWNKSGDKRLRIKGTIVQDSGGNESDINVDRGIFSLAETYYIGNILQYNGATYRCKINNTSGILPTNASYYTVYAAKGETGATGATGPQGVAGAPGADGITYYTWIRYADTSTGGGISNDPTGKLYIGFAYNKTTATESNTPSDYTWSLIKGEKGDTGVQGATGANGITYYTWIKYSDNSDGTGLYDTPTSNTQYIGIAVNKTTPTESTVKTDYTWSKFKGEKGDQGIQGLQGIQGEKGDQGIPGVNGANGETTYFHVKYSDHADGTNMNDVGGLYIGTYVDFTATDSTDKTKYKWVLIKGVQGDKGDQGIPGVNGANGETSYLHIKYSDDGGVTFTANNGEDTGAYIGQYTDFVQLDSSDPTKYTWSKITGTDGSDGTPGTDGINGSAGEYYEYRYAKNGSTVTPPALDTSVPEPAGWSKTMPTLGTLEYLWCTIAKKSSLVDNTMVHLPINASDTTSIADTSGKGRNATLSNGATVASDSRGYVLNLNGAGESQIPMDLPWGKSFTICFWAKTDMSSLSWMLNCYLGREYIEQPITMTANQWAHLAFRFNEKTITVFKDGTQIYIGSTKEAHAGFSLYDDNLFGTNASFDEIRVFDSALSSSDIAKVIGGTVDNLVQAWSAPVRVNGVDGANGDKGDKGDTGTTGNVIVSMFAKNGSMTIPPNVNNTEANPLGWSSNIPTATYLEYVWEIKAEKTVSGQLVGTWSNPVRISGIGGGSPVGGLDYDPTKIYVGSPIKCDVVKYNSVYYIARIDAGNIPAGTLPTNTSYYNSFGSSFESIATAFLWTESARIANFIYDNQKMVSQAQTNGVPNLSLDGISGLIKMLKAEIGRFKVLNGDIIGFDANGNERSRFSAEVLPPIADLNQGWTIIGDGEESYQYDTFERDDSIELNKNSGSYMFDFNLSISQPCNIRIGAQGGSYSFNPYTSGLTINESNTISIIKDGVIVQQGGIDQIYYLSAGNYTFRWIYNISVGGMPNGTSIEASINMGYQGIEAQITPARTLIGSDGLYSIFSGGEYIYFKNGYGFEAKAGSYGIQVTTAGVKKWNGSSWALVNW